MGRERARLPRPRRAPASATPESLKFQPSPLAFPSASGSPSSLGNSEGEEDWPLPCPLLTQSRAFRLQREGVGRWGWGPGDISLCHPAGRQSWQESQEPTLLPPLPLHTPFQSSRAGGPESPPQVRAGILWVRLGPGV